MLPRIAIALLAAGALAQESDESIQKDKAIYFHPLFTVITASIDELPIYLPITFENELEDGKSIVLQPTFILGSIQGSSDNYIAPPKTDVFGIQMMASMRKYFNGDHCTGVYGAPAIGLTYAKASRSASSYYSEQSASVLGFGVLGYLGARGKWGRVTTYVDVGIGHQWASVSGDSNAEGVSLDGLALDLNLGIGFPF